MSTHATIRRQVDNIVSILYAGTLAFQERSEGSQEGESVRAHVDGLWGRVLWDRPGLRAALSHSLLLCIRFLQGCLDGDVLLRDLSGTRRWTPYLTSVCFLHHHCPLAQVPSLC